MLKLVITFSLLLAAQLAARDNAGGSNPTAYQEAANYSRTAKGVAVLVMKRGEIVFEDYAPGWSEKPHLLASGTKSFSGLMAACAVEDGLLQLDEKVSDTLPNWKPRSTN